MDVKYRWSFLVSDELNVERRERIIPSQIYIMAPDEDEATETDDMKKADQAVSRKLVIPYMIWTLSNFLSL